MGKVFGTWRLFLAMLVVVGHLYDHFWAASYAVFSFYALSGYLMSLILNEKYGFSGEGFRAFWRARALRLLPSYWAACLFSLLLITLSAPDSVQGWNDKLTIPSTAYEIVSNLTMVGIMHPHPGLGDAAFGMIPSRFSTLVPPAWALSIELFFYLALSLFFARSAYHAAILLLAGLAYTTWADHSDLGFYFKYFFFPAGATPFAVGALVYFALQVPEIAEFFRRRSIFVSSLSAYLLIFTLAYFFEHLRYAPLFSINILTSAALIMALSETATEERVNDSDRFLGDLSYPVYLFHLQIGLVVSLATGHAQGTMSLLLVSIPFVLLVAVTDRRLISGPIERWRRLPASLESEVSGGLRPASGLRDRGRESNSLDARRSSSAGRATHS